MDKAPPWIFLLIGIAFFEEGLAEFRKRDFVVSLVFFGLALISFIATIIAAETRNTFSLTEIVGVPPLLPYALTALIVSVLLGLVREYRRDTTLKNKLTTLSVALREFQVECEARIARASTTTTFADAKRWGTTEFFVRFSSPINQLKDSWSLVVPFGAEYSEMLLGTHLTKPSAERLASAASNEINKASERLPNPKSWIKRKSFLRSLSLYLGLAAVAWSTLFVVAKSRALSPAMLNVENSESPFPIPAGANLISAASGADRDTELILPPATGSGDTHAFEKIDKNTTNVVVVPHGSDTIDGDRKSVKMTGAYNSFKVLDIAPGHWVTGAL
jgi:hypothetical protein